MTARPESALPPLGGGAVPVRGAVEREAMGAEGIAGAGRAQVGRHVLREYDSLA
jgi:hypothetical protein